MTDYDFLLHCLVRDLGAEYVVRRYLAAEELHFDSMCENGESAVTDFERKLNFEFFVSREEFKIARRHKGKK